MENNPPPHLALALGDQERIDYFLLVATLILADGKVDDAETDRLAVIAQAASLRGPAAEQVIAAARFVAPERLDRILERIKQDRPLAQALLTDAIVIVFADRHVDVTEAVEIRSLADRLGFVPQETAEVAHEVERSLADVEGQALASTLVEGLGEGRAGAPATPPTDPAAEADAADSGSAAQPPSATATAVRWLYRLLRREAKT